MADINPTLSMVTLNANWLNAPFKRQKLAKWGEDPTMYYLQEKHFRFKETNRMKVKSQKNTFHSKGNKKKKKKNPNPSTMGHPFLNKLNIKMKGISV